MAEQNLRPNTTPEQDVVLEVRNVTKTFPGVIANADVNIQLRRGEILALLGENGAGKSTLMNIIYGLYHQDQGEIFLNGREVRFASPREAIRSGIGMVHQHFQLVDVMTVAENVILGDEKESPTWSSLFNAFFTFIFGILFTVLLVAYNDNPLVYTSLTFAIVGLLLPWYIQRYLFTRLGFAVIGLAALTFGLSAANITYPDQYLFVDIMIFVGLLLLLYIGTGFIPRIVFAWIDKQRRWLTIALQLITLSILLTAGADSTNPLDAFGDYSTALGNAFQEQNSHEFEVLISLIGMGIFGGIGALIPHVLSDKNPIQSHLAQFAPPTKVEAKVWYTSLSLILLGAIGLLVTALTTLLAIAVWPDTNVFSRWREFMLFANVGLMLSSIIVAALSYLATLAFNSWEQVVGIGRVVWGATWRIGLIAVVVWLGIQARNISEMAIITSILQTPVQVETVVNTPRDLEGVTLEGKARSEELIELSWRTIDREPSRAGQIKIILAEIDENFYNEATGEYEGISKEWRDAVTEVPPIVDDITVGLLLILCGVLSIRTWRGTKLLPTKLSSIGLGIMGIFVVVYAIAIIVLLDEISLVAELALFVIGLAAMGAAFYFTYQDRQRDPDRIRSITPLDTVIDAITDLIYTILSVRRTQEAAERVRELSKQYGLEVDPYAVIEKLPVGLQQRVEIVKALYRKADILILDEPTAVLTPQEGEELFKIMRELSAQGVSIIFITHKLKEVFKVATNIVVMRGGRVVGTTTPAEATEASLAAMMVGRDVILRVEKEDAKPEAPVLCVEGLQATDDRGAKALQGVSFEVRAGEVLGIAGVQGNGQSELVEVLTGLRPMDEGEVELLGQALKPKRYADASILRRGAAVLFDFVIEGMLAAFISYFWSYFSVGVEDFRLLSRQTLSIFLILDAVYTISSWILPLALGTSSATSNELVDLDEQAITPVRHTAGQTLGKLAMNIHITRQDDSAPTISALLIRYLGQTISRYFLPVYLVITALQAFLGQKSDPFLKRWSQRLQNAWYDQLPLVHCRVAYHAAITPRKIKDLATSHVPEDRLRFGMVKSFSVAENLILNDYYEAPHAKPPSVVQLPFVTTVYTALFASIFAFLGYLWLDAWNDSLWTRLLDAFGVPDTPTLRTVPTEVAMTAAQRNNLNDPLLVSLVTLLVVVTVFSIISYLLMRLLVKYLVNPLSIIPPLTFFGIAYGLIALIDRGLGAVDLQALWLPIMGLLNTLLDSSISFEPEINQMIIAGLGLVFLLISGILYDQIRPQISSRANEFLRHNAIGQTILQYDQRGLSLNIKDEAAYSQRLIQQYDIRTPSPFTSGGSLSGGNQQKVVVAREFSRQPRLLIASQPTRGIDVGSIEFIHKQIINQRDQGAAVLLVSAELDEVMSLSDRIAVMYKGEIIKVVDAKDATREELGLLMAGIVQH